MVDCIVGVLCDSDWLEWEARCKTEEKLSFDDFECLIKKFVRLEFNLTNVIFEYLINTYDWSRGEQWILSVPENLSVSRDEVEENIEIRGEQNSLFPEGPVIKWFVT